MIAGPGVYICNECVGLCVEIILEEDQSVLESELKRVGFVKTDLAKNVSEILGLRPVFGPPPEVTRKKHCFYVGPFRSPFNEIYKDHILPAVTGKGLTISRGDEIFSTNAVIDDVWAGISTATLIVAELTGKNPNVLYEVGMAHTLGKPVLLISQNIEDIPFDLRHRRALIYSYTPPGCRKLEQEIAATAAMAVDL